MIFLIINGPNLNLLGIREKNIYGDVSFEAYFEQLKRQYDKIGLEYFQSNVEGELINEIHRAGFSYDGVIINAGAYAHTSIAIADAISSITAPVVEVHISNIHKREPFRSRTMLGKSCLGTITGFGLDSYRLGIEALLGDLTKAP